MTGPSLGRRCAAFLSAAVLLGATPGWTHADGEDAPRAYLNIRGGGSNPWTHVRDYWGVSAGADFNRHLGAELSADIFERRIRLSGFGSVGEYGLIALVPQVRLRYPLLDGRLTPYLVGGAGVALSEFNDRKAGTFGRSVDADHATPVGTIGAGIEYALADSVALGIEMKYLVAGDQAVRIDGRSHAVSIDSLFMSVGLRAFYPERPTARPAEGRERPPTRLYLALRAGGALVTYTDISREIEIRPEPPALASLNQYFGASLGLDLGRHLGVELAGEGYEARVAVAGIGSVAEYAVYAIMPQVRFRYPLLEGRLVPYALAGIGWANAEINDRKPPGAGVEIRAGSSGLAAAVGGGLEYFLTHHLALGAETKYLYTRGLTLQLGNGRRHEANLGGLIFSLSLRVYLADF